MEESLTRTVDRLHAGVREGLHLGAQLYVSSEGSVVADVAVGNATRTKPMTSGTITVWMSLTKGITAVAVAQMWEKGEIEIDDPVCSHLPDFGAGGKERLTFRHLLTHTAEIGPVDVAWSESSWEEIVAKIWDAPLRDDCLPGRQARYDVANAWFVLGEVVSRKRGMAFDRYVHQEIFGSLNMSNCYLSMDSSTYRSKKDQIGLMYDTAGRSARAVALQHRFAKNDQPMRAGWQWKGARKGIGFLLRDVARERPFQREEASSSPDR